jgi:hypothetical protein
MVGSLVLIAVLLSGVGFVLWRYENSAAICFEEGQILEKWVAPGYDPFFYSPLIHLPPSWVVEERFLVRSKLRELGCINVKVDQRIFEEVEKGKLVVVVYQMGRVTGQLRIIDLC